MKKAFITIATGLIVVFGEAQNLDSLNQRKIDSLKQINTEKLENYMKYAKESVVKNTYQSLTDTLNKDKKKEEEKKLTKEEVYEKLSNIALRVNGAIGLDELSKLENELDKLERDYGDYVNSNTAAQIRKVIAAKKKDKAAKKVTDEEAEKKAGIVTEETPGEAKEKAKTHIDELITKYPAAKDYLTEQKKQIDKSGSTDEVSTLLKIAEDGAKMKAAGAEAANKAAGETVKEKVNRELSNIVLRVNGAIGLDELLKLENELDKLERDYGNYVNPNTAAQIRKVIAAKKGKAAASAGGQDSLKSYLKIKLDMIAQEMKSVNSLDDYTVLKNKLDAVDCSGDSALQERKKQLYLLLNVCKNALSSADRNIDAGTLKKDESTEYTLTEKEVNERLSNIVLMVNGAIGLDELSKLENEFNELMRGYGNYVNPNTAAQIRKVIAAKKK